MKIVMQIKFEGVWGELEAKSFFQRQLFTKYLRFEIANCGKSSINILQEIFASTYKIFI